MHQLEGQIPPPEQAVHPGHQRRRLQVGILEGPDRSADLHQAAADAVEQGGGLVRHPGGQTAEQVFTGLQAVAHAGDQIGNRRQEGAPAGQLLGAGQGQALEQPRHLSAQVAAQQPRQIGHQIE